MNSILIITYKRENELLETLKCFNGYSGKMLEILILDNNQTNNLEQKISNIFSKENIRIKYYNDGKNYGVCLGRNYLIQKASGDILITLDDDIEIKEDINMFILKIEKYFENEKIGCLAFKIINYYTQKQLRHEIPHGNKKINFDKNLKTYYFIGAGHAIRKKIYSLIGDYPKDLGIYGGEERDLAFRILESGYEILYTVDLLIYHKVALGGRLKVKQKNFYMYRNYLIVFNKYMPNLYCISANFIWSIYYIFKLNGKLTEVKETLKLLKKVEKRTISNETLKKIKEMKGRVFY